ICGAYYYDSGVRSFRCGNALPGRGARCWCRLQIRMDRLLGLLIDFLLQMLASDSPVIMDAFLQAALRELQRLQSTHQQQIDDLRTQRQGIQKSVERLYTGIEAAADAQVATELTRRLEQKSAD